MSLPNEVIEFLNNNAASNGSSDVGSNSRSCLPAARLGQLCARRFRDSPGRTLRHSRSRCEVIPANFRTIEAIDLYVNDRKELIVKAFITASGTHLPEQVITNESWLRSSDCRQNRSSNLPEFGNVAGLVGGQTTSSLAGNALVNSSVARRHRLSVVWHDDSLIGSFQVRPQLFRQPLA